METKELLELLVKEVAAQNKLIALQILDSKGIIHYDSPLSIKDEKFIKDKVRQLINSIKED